MRAESTDEPRFDIAQPEFWRRPLQDLEFHAVTTCDEVVEISRSFPCASLPRTRGRGLDSTRPVAPGTRDHHS